jgi:hypothetical protein
MSIPVTECACSVMILGSSGTPWIVEFMGDPENRDRDDRGIGKDTSSMLFAAGSPS